MNQIHRVVFVCMTNTCVSNMAESVMRSVFRDGEFEIASRGLVVLFPEPLNPKAVAVMKSNGVMPARDTACQLTAEDITDDTLILTMTSKEAVMVRENFPEARNVSPLGRFAGQPCDIEAPHGGKLAEYGACYEYIDLLVKLAAEKLIKRR